MMSNVTTSNYVKDAHLFCATKKAIAKLLPYFEIQRNRANKSESKYLNGYVMQLCFYVARIFFFSLHVIDCLHFRGLVWT